MTKKVKKISASIVIPYRKKREIIELWMQERVSSDSIGGLLEFPGGKINKNESAIDAAIREFIEETGQEINKNDLRFLGNWFPEFDEIDLLLYVYYIENEEMPKTDNWYDISGFDRLYGLKSKVPPSNFDIICTFLEEMDII